MAKKMGGLALLLFVVIGAYLWRVNETGDNKSNLTVISPSDSRQLSKLPEKDSDGDGIKDWQEVLENETFNIETTALEPIGGNTQTNAEYAYAYDQFKDKTPTEELGINLAANYLNAKASGSIDQSTIEQIATNLANSALADVVVKKYTLNSLAYSADTAEARRIYVKEVSEVMARHYDSLVEANDEIQEIFISIATYESLDQAVSLRSSARAYTSFKNALLDVRVPRTPGFASAHLSLVNSLEAMATALPNMSATAHDPITFTSWMQIYKAGDDTSGIALDKMDTLASAYQLKFGTQ